MVSKSLTQFFSCWYVSVTIWWAAKRSIPLVWRYFDKSEVSVKMRRNTCAVKTVSYFKSDFMKACAFMRTVGLKRELSWIPNNVSTRATYKALSVWANDPNIFWSAASLEDHLVSPFSEILRCWGSWLTPFPNVHSLIWVPNKYCNVVNQSKYCCCCYHDTCSFSHYQVENVRIAPHMNLPRSFLWQPCRKPPYGPCMFAAPSVEFPVHFFTSILHDSKVCFSSFRNSSPADDSNSTTASSFSWMLSVM